MKEVLKAAEIIGSQGLSGANEAALLVGPKTAITMLLTHLAGDDESKTVLLKEAGLLDGTAYICPETGYGLIYVPDGCGDTTLKALAVVDGKCVELEYNSGMSTWPDLNNAFRHAPKNTLIKLFLGESPYTELKEILLREHTTWSEENGIEAVQIAKSAA